ncbi:MAG: hypothetical protein BWY46_01070 [Firmicutes bacterium ADurb.Bin300]|nr:MAG: hypothetical protein BWY46_01070 [Firmicutes bacterium ADurb.Bin300]
MFLLLFRFAYFAILIIIFINAIKAAIKMRKKKTKKEIWRCSILFIVFIIGLFLSVLMLDMSPRINENNIQQAANIIFEIKENDELSKSQAIVWDYKTAVCAGTISFRENLSSESIQKKTIEVKDWADVSGIDGDVYYYFSPVIASRNSVYFGLPQASRGNIILIKDNDYISIGYHYTTINWFDYFIAPIFSPEYLYREEINLMDIATAEKKDIRTVEIPIEQR